MIKKFKIDDKNIEIFYDNIELEEIPVVIINTFENNGKDIFLECAKINCRNYILVAISNLNWNDDLTPWFAPKLNNSDKDFMGKADEYIRVLIDDIIPQVKRHIIDELNIKISYYSIAGYSLAGLFALYCAYKTDLFKKVASASGSFWYPRFFEFIRENKISSSVCKIYFSLGNKECKTKNEVMSTVEANTIKIEKIYKEAGINTCYEENEGNHFKNVNLRLAKGIKWILD